MERRKKFEPYPYQKYCIDRIIHDDAVGLFLHMGLGKTVITLTAIQDLIYNRFRVNKALVIAPKKVAEMTWKAEADKWEHLRLLRFSHVLGSRENRIRALNVPADVYVINRENTAWLVDYYQDRWPFDMVVIDELSSFKNHQSKRFKALKKIRPKIKKIVGLTGTPAPNGYHDLWAQVYLLDRGERLGRYITHYRDRYFVPDFSGYGYNLKPGADRVIREKIADICVSMKAEDYISLPERVDNVIPVKLDSKALKLYQKFEREFVAEVTGCEITAANAAALSNKLLQLCNGAVYDDDGQVHEIHNCKIDALMELLEQLNGNPALLFYTFQHDLHRLKRALTGTGLRVRELKTADDQRDWNAGKIDVLLAHPASAGHGLNLQEGGNHVVWFGLTWSLELYQQANSRLHRQGQTQKVVVHHLVVQEGIDRDVMRALQSKEKTQDALIEALKARIGGGAE